MGGFRPAQPDGGPPAGDRASVAVEHLPLAELYEAIGRTAEHFRADLQALDDRPVTLPDHPWLVPTAPTSADARGADAVSAGPPTARPARAALIPARAAPARPDARPRRHLRWLGALILIPTLAILTVAIPGRRPGAATATAPVAAPVSSPIPASGAPARVAAPPVTLPTSGPVPTAIPPTIAPATIPTTAPNALPTASPTAVPAATLPAPTALAAQVAAAEAALRSGTFEVAIDYGQGSRSTVIVQFDLGDQGRERRLSLMATSIGRTGEQQLELLAVGNRVWQRRPGGDWRPGVSQDGLWEQLQAYLPQIRGARDLTVARSGEVLVMRWANPARGAELELQLAASDGRPLRLRESTPATGMVMAVIYAGWDTPVTIAPPGP